jgi:hypothetical protein
MFQKLDHSEVSSFWVTQWNVSLPSRKDREMSSFWSVVFYSYIQFWMMDKVQKHCDSEWFQKRNRFIRDVYSLLPDFTASHTRMKWRDCSDGSKVWDSKLLMQCLNNLTCLCGQESKVRWTRQHRDHWMYHVTLQNHYETKTSQKNA